MRNKSKLKKEVRVVHTKRGTTKRSFWVKAYSGVTGRKVAVRKTSRLKVDIGTQAAGAVTRGAITTAGRVIGGSVGHAMGKTLSAAAPFPGAGWVASKVGRAVGSTVGGVVAFIPASIVSLRVSRRANQALAKRVK